MRSSIITVSLLSALTALPALADEAASPVSGNFSVASEYLYRGIAQSNRKPAVQGGIDYVHDSGLYVGAWGSNISWLSDTSTAEAKVSSSLELDTYGGYKLGLGDVTLDFGALKYWYPGTYPAGYSNPETLEGYLGGSWKFATFKYSYAFTNLFGAQSVQADGSLKKSEGSQYFDLSLNPELGAGFTLNLHAGRQLVANYPSASYNDYKLGVSYLLPQAWTLSAAYITTSAKASSGDFYRSTLNRDLGADRFVVSLGRTF